MIFSNEVIAALLRAEDVQVISGNVDPVGVANEVQGIIETERRQTMEAIAFINEILHETKMSRGKGSHEATNRFVWFQSQGRPKLQLILSRLEEGIGPTEPFLNKPTAQA